MRRPLGAALLLMALALSGCRRDGVSVETANEGPTRITNIEVEYNGGSFGITALEPGKSHRRWIKFLGDSQLTYTYLDNAGQQHTFKEGAFKPSSTGRVRVAIGPGGRVTLQQFVGTF